MGNECLARKFYTILSQSAMQSPSGFCKLQQKWHEIFGLSSIFFMTKNGRAKQKIKVMRKITHYPLLFTHYSVAQKRQYLALFLQLGSLSACCAHSINSACCMNAAITARKFLNATSGINEFLLASEEWMASGTNTNSKITACGTCLVNSTAGTDNGCFVIFRMFAVFHGAEKMP